MDTRPTFDALARDYDTQFSQSLTARWLRDQIHARLTLHFPSGSRVLELGCGTGEDALRLAQRGVHVVATDVSPAMLAIAAAKTAALPGIRLASLDLRHLPESAVPPLDGWFDGAFASFGPLNCLNDWRPLAVWLAARVRPGGLVAFAMMSRFCLGEILWHSAHGHFRTATRRLGGSASFDAGGDCATIHYPTAAHLARSFTPEFQRVALRPLGLALPPSDAYGAVERRPRLYRALLAAERRLSRVGALSELADHYWIEFRRTARKEA